MHRRGLGILCLTAITTFAACGPAEGPTAPVPPFASSTTRAPEFAGSMASRVSLDIKPGSCPNPINPVSQGKTPVALAGSVAFDVASIDVESIRLEGVAPIRHSVEDVTSPGGCCELTPLIRVNAGGELTPDSPAWLADTEAAPSPYANTGFAASTNDAIDVSHPSIPAGTPMSIFQSERWHFNDEPPLRWEFPVAAGDYTVRLYFAEIYPRVMAVGGRTFDVSLEGDLVLDDYDIFGDVGGWAGVVKEFETTVSDGSLSLEFTHETENPKVSAIEILYDGGAPQPDGIDDLVLKFDTQELVAALGPLSQGDEKLLTLTGSLLDGSIFTDTDCVVSVGRADPPRSPRPGPIEPILEPVKAGM